MGACGSKEIAGQGRARDLSRWKADDAEAAGRADGHITDTQAATQTQAHQDELTLNAVVAYFSPGQQRDAAAAATDLCATAWEDGSVKLLDWTRTNAVVATFRPHARAANRLVVGARSGAIYSCSRDTTVAVLLPPPSPSDWADASAIAAPTVLAGHSLNVATITVDADETALCSGGRDTQTILWDLATARPTARNTTAQNVVTCSKWLPGERVVAQGSEDLSLKLWDARTALRSPAQTLRGFVYFPLCLDAAHDGYYLLTSSKGVSGVGCEARVWDRRTGKTLHELRGHQQDATACCLLPDGGAGDDTVDRETTPRSGDHPAAAAADGVGVSLPVGGMSTPVTASKDGTVKLWDLAVNAPLAEARDPLGRMFTSVASVGRGRLVASTLDGRVVALAVDAHRRSLRVVE